MKNYLTIVEKLNSGLVGAYKTNNKALAKNIVEQFKNPKLATLNKAIHNLSNERISPEMVDKFIQENVDFVRKYDYSDLNTFLSEEKTRSNEYLSDLGMILFEEKNIHNLADYTRAYQNVRNRLIENFQWKKSADEKMSSLEESISSLDDDDKLMVENYIKNDVIGRKNIFEDVKNECVQMIKDFIGKETSLETKLNLYETKEIISNMSPSSEDYIPSLVKLHQLKKELKG